MTIELIARSTIYILVTLVLLAGAFWWGWDMRARLALKLEYFRITNRQWADYDTQLKKGELPRRAELHDIKYRESER
jgi:hypothetical protein